MKKILVLLSVLAVMLLGCGKQSDYDTEKRQFIEILSENNELLGIMEDSKSIEEFTKKLDIESWEYCDHLVNDAKLKYTYKGYEVVDDPFYLEGNAPYINRDVIELYEAKSDFYIVDFSEDSRDIVKVTKRTGKYLGEPQKLNISAKKTAEELISKWKTEIDGLQDQLDNTESDVDSDKGCEHSDEDFEIITEENIRKVSKEQRMDILDSENQVVLYSTSKISKITDILNKLSMNEWKEVHKIPDRVSAEVNIIRYALNRKTTKHELIKMCQEVLYKDEDDYYMKEIIPNNGTQKKDYIKYYKIPKETAEFIYSLS